MTRLSTLAAALIAIEVLTHAVPALAQQAPEEATEPVAKKQLPVVIVTAQKRLQASSKVPLALSVVSDEDIKSMGISTAANLTEQVPNTQITPGSAGAMQIFIRGIGNADSTEKGDPAAAFHIDGIYIARPQGAGATFYDLERVEVLRGPQGTLYGRNANAGAINLISRRPGAKFAAALSAELGNYNTRKVDAMVNVPVNEVLALRAVVSSQKHDGYADTANALSGFGRDADDKDNLSGRVQALLKFSPQASWLLGVDRSRDKGAGGHLYEFKGNGLPSSRTDRPAVQGRIDNATDGVLSELKLGLGATDLTYLYGRRTSARDEFSGITQLGLVNQFSWDFAQQSHELRLNSADSGPLQWVAGLYYFAEDGSLDLDMTTMATMVRFQHIIQNPVSNRSKAAFGQATYSLTPDWRVTLGLRSNADRKARVGETRFGPNDIRNPKNDNIADRSWTKQTYRLALEHDLDQAQMIYAAFATGYKAGGFNGGNDVPGAPGYRANLYYSPESIQSLEAGIKGRYLGNSLQLGATAFHYVYDDLQVSSVGPDRRLFTSNAGKATVTGAELEGRAVMAENGRVNFALGLLSAKYKEYIAPNGADLSGKAMDRSPKATLSLGYTHDWDLPSGARISAYGGLRYTSSYTLSDAGVPSAAGKTFVQPSFTKSDITLTYASADDKWSVQAYVKNLEDKLTVSSLSTVQSGLVYAAVMAEPRTLGLRASFRF